ncbi:MAG: hypothetical protein LBC02_11615 [Planctomycetaceae bacterium]|jgi:hypothetical protein|nr:hypothetical protein [Planctomycetaceae bacterium]
MNTILKTENLSVMIINTFYATKLSVFCTGWELFILSGKIESGQTGTELTDHNSDMR